jgi:hypothetical protein
MFTINYQDLNGNSALHYCAYYNRIESAKILLKANVNIDTINNMNQTAYDVANQSLNYELAKEIQQHGEGRSLSSIKWFQYSDEDPLSDDLEEEQDVQETLDLQRSRPASMKENKFGIDLIILKIFILFMNS